MKSFVVMGVSGCGKSSVAKLLAERSGGVFLDADDFHPPENKAKMRAGVPLSDDDRWGWLDSLNAALKQRLPEGKAVFLACSALRKVYRDRLSNGIPELRFIYLKGTRELIQQRLQNRHGHFMSPTLLASQFEILEEPTEAIVASIEGPPGSIVDHIANQMNLLP